MLGPGSENIALLRHARAADGMSCNQFVSFASRQASCFRIIELPLKLGISLATLAIDPAPNWGIICSRAGIQSYGAAAKDNNDGKGQKLSDAHFQISNRSSLAREAENRKRQSGSRGRIRNQGRPYDSCRSLRPASTTGPSPSASIVPALVIDLNCEALRHLRRRVGISET
jgi:hypothetical protein